jgi:amino acid adenylation domain-containing protein
MQSMKTIYPEIQPCRDEYYPLSFQQERVLYLNKLSAEGPLWNRISCKRLRGNIDRELLRRAIDALIERHSVLRTRIALIEGKPLQSKHGRLRQAFEFCDFSAQPVRAAEEQAGARLNQEYEKPFCLQGGELFKAVLIRRSPDEFWLILKLHHIISDETTLRVLWNDLKLLYNSHFDGAATLPSPSLEYFDYAKWLREHFQENDTQPQESYWTRQFAGELPELDLPSDAAGSPKFTFQGSLEKQAVPQQLVKRIQSFSLEQRVVPFSVMLSACYLLLRKYCRQDDIVIGTVFSGRHYSPNIKLLAGFFSNTVALRTHCDSTQTAEVFVRKIHAQVTDAYEMQDFPFQRLVDKLDPVRSSKRNPLFRAMFNMITGYKESHVFQGVQQEEWLEPQISATQVDFFLDFHMNPENPEVRIEYNSDIFSRETIQRMLRHYLTLVQKIVDFPAATIGELTMLDAGEEQQVLSFAKGDTEPPPCTRTIVAALEDRAARTPEQTVLISADGTVNCGQFNKKVNQLAATLVRSGVGEGNIVAIMLERSPELAVAIMAVLKAGAAYLPIDPGFPSSRVEYILRDSGATCLLAQSDATHVIAQKDLTIIAVDKPESYTGDGSNLNRRVDLSGKAYVIYTSGSTGKPKGVVVEHHALMNTLEFLEAKYSLAGKTILLKTNFTFDVSCTEIFGWIFGGRLAVLDKGAEKDPRRLLQAIKKYDVTHINFVPSMLDAFLAGIQETDIPILERLEYVFVAGEALKPDLVSRFYGMIRNVRLENLYGPTEAAIYATWYSLPRDRELQRVPIGRPISNTRAYILDEDLKLLPVGVTGELCLSGAGLAHGYLNQPEFTEEKFCPNPYWQGEKLYRTGDQAKWGEDGLIQFLGRADGQVKIRGFRVELGEVERKLLACRGVKEAAVTARADRFGQKGLVAYFAMAKGRDGAPEELRKELANWLPNYMIPDFFVQLDQMPRLPSGKTDLQALPEPHSNCPGPEVHRVETTELEKVVIKIAEELLNTTGLTPDSNFFRLGGNSILTLRFVAALDQALGTTLSIMDFLELPTISQIAKLLEPMLPAKKDLKEGQNGRGRAIPEREECMTEVTR